MTRPFISVIVPAYNVEHQIGEALASVVAQLYEPLETIVVDDGSSDRTAAVARDSADKLIAADHGGASRARNLGVRAARGELIAFLDADDIWTEGALVARAEYLSHHPEIDFVFGQMLDFIDPHSPRPAHLDRTLLTVARPAPMPTLVARAHMFETVGGFDPKFVVGEDLDWLARAQEAGFRGTMLDAVFLRKRLHPGSVMARNAQSAAPALARVLKASLDRQRARSRVDGPDAGPDSSRGPTP
jgi:glycosyltransferase involved in cell wall biosynthesis